jgi:CRISPR-associated protein Csb2
MRRAQEVLGEVPEVLSGHEEGRPSARTHAAYLALPFVSQTQAHADGHILGVAVALPRGLAAAERRRALRALTALDHLDVAGVGRLGLRRLAPGEPAPLNLRPATWEGPALRWASATPVLLDRFPRRGGRGLGAIVARGCGYVGLPLPEEVVAGRHSPLHGVEPSSRFVTRRGAGDAPPRLYTHVTLTFTRPVRGPVVTGAGRHFGLGLLRPLQGGGGRDA